MTEEKKSTSSRYASNSAANTEHSSSSDNDESTEDANYYQDRETLQIINRIKDISQRMMAYAIKNPSIDIDEKLLGTIIPLLRKNSATFTDEDEINLWTSYNQLTEIVKPATNTSLLIAEQLNEEMGQGQKSSSSFKFWQKKTSTPLSSAVEKCHRELRTIFLYLITSVVLYVLIQGYCGLLSGAIDNVSNRVNAWKKQQEMIVNSKASNNEQETALQIRISELDRYQVASSVQFLVDLTVPVLILSNNDVAKQNCAEIMEHAKSENDEQKIAACITFQKQYAGAALGLLSQYILPLILGVLGATAFIVRSTLEKLQTDSYLPNADGKLSMRLCLGGLLGVISGIFISTSTEETLKGFNINLVMISLIMGYSVEVAFSLFDSIVERLRSWTESLKKA